MQLKTIVGLFPNLSKSYKAAVLGVPLLAVVALYNPYSDEYARKSIQITIPESTVIQQVLTEQAELKDVPEFEYVIRKGDTLSTIFDHLGFSYSDMMKITETDLDYLSLDTIMPGDTLRFWATEDGQSVAKMELELSLDERVVYERLDDGTYQYTDVKIPGVWEEFPVVGSIRGSFSQSANRSGISTSDIEQIVTLLKGKIDFAKDIQRGDRFEVVQSRQLVNDTLTGNSEIKAIKINTRSKSITAYLHSDGQFYDQNGRSLQKAFQRYPTERKIRISSGFDAHRLHPVTHRIAPHNGTDFSMPTGTPVVATGDGVVVMLRSHPYAGNYVVIKHDNTYSTRYLHLSKFLVKAGQRVQRGQRIGLSGATGRVTGPHLHYELLVHGRAVNAMTAQIPMARGLVGKEMLAFVSRRNQLDKMLHKQELRLSAASAEKSESADDASVSKLDNAAADLNSRRLSVKSPIGMKRSTDS